MRRTIKKGTHVWLRGMHNGIKWVAPEVGVVLETIRDVDPSDGRRVFHVSVGPPRILDGGGIDDGLREVPMDQLDRVVPRPIDRALRRWKRAVRSTAGPGVDG